VLTTLPGRDRSTDGWVVETFAALARLPVDGPAPVVWPFTPHYPGNPVQQILHGSFAEHAMVAAPAFRIEDLRATTRHWPADLPLVVHLHWLNQVLAAARTTADADAALAAHEDLLDTLKRRGARLVWTVHNALPHDLRYEEHEVRLRRAVIDRVDLVHIMSPRTAELVAPWFELPPDRLYQCDHPGYQGVYPDWITPAQARRRLRVPDGARVVLLAGALKPYKGMGELLSAVERVDAERPGSVVLVMAGKPDDAPRTRALLARAALHPAVRLVTGTIPDADVQVLMRAADVVALPYQRSLNSGVLALALTFGRPVLLPSDSGSVPLVQAPDATGPAGVVYPAGSRDGLVDAIRSCRLLDLEAMSLASARAGARIDRTAVSARFAADLRGFADRWLAEGWRRP
jgi:beta-1,4-mannosyltransferase